MTKRSTSAAQAESAGDAQKALGTKGLAFVVWAPQTHRRQPFVDEIEERLGRRATRSWVGRAPDCIREENGAANVLVVFDTAAEMASLDEANHIRWLSTLLPSSGDRAFSQRLASLGGSGLICLHGLKAASHPDGGFQIEPSDVRLLAKSRWGLLTSYTTDWSRRGISQAVKTPTRVPFRGWINSSHAGLFLAGTFDISEVSRRTGVQPQRVQVEIPGDFRYTKSLWELRRRYDHCRRDGRDVESLVAAVFSDLGARQSRWELRSIAASTNSRCEFGWWVSSSRRSYAVWTEPKHLAAVADCGAGLDLWFDLRYDRDPEL